MRFLGFGLLMAAMALAQYAQADSHGLDPIATQKDLKAHQVLDAQFLGLLPTWARTYYLKHDASGNAYLYANIDGCEIFVRPTLWSKLQMANKQGVAINYGYLPDMVSQHPGTVVTNDPAGVARVLNGRETAATMSTSTAQDDANCPPATPNKPAPAPDYSQFVIPGAILVAAMLILFSRRRSS